MGGTGLLDSRAPSLQDFSTGFLNWVESTGLARQSKRYYCNGWRLLSKTHIVGMRLDHIACNHHATGQQQPNGAGVSPQVVLELVSTVIEILQHRHDSANKCVGRTLKFLARSASSPSAKRGATIRSGTPSTTSFWEGNKDR
jgi:hypothetical protein